MYTEIQITAIATCWREMPFRKVRHSESDVYFG
jgi:hypothetical protein